MMGDLSVINGGVDIEQGLETAVMMSLFTWGRANDDDILPDSTSDDLRGWWGELASPEVEGDKFGSRLWIYTERAKTTEKVLMGVKNAAQEALRWMIEDGVAAKVDVDVERAGNPGNDRLYYQVRIYKKDGNIETFVYDTYWEGQFNGI